MAKFPKLSKALDFDSIESSSDGIHFQEAQVEKIEALAAEHETQAATIGNLNGTIATQTETIAANATEINALKQDALAKDNTIAQLNADLKTAKDANVSAADKDSKITELNAQLEAANKKIETLEAKIAGKPTEDTEPGATGNEGSGKKAKYSYTQKLAEQNNNK